jgi:hypothetical protein
MKDRNHKSWRFEERQSEKGRKKVKDKYREKSQRRREKSHGEKGSDRQWSKERRAR